MRSSAPARSAPSALLASQTFQSARAQSRVPGANERIRIGIVGFSDRLKSALLPAYQSVADQFNGEIVGVSDLWSRRRDEAKAYQVGSQRRSGPTYKAAHDYLKSGKFGPIVAAEMTWNVNQPGRWRRSDLTTARSTIPRPASKSPTTRASATRPAVPRRFTIRMAASSTSPPGKSPKTAAWTKKPPAK